MSATLTNMCEFIEAAQLRVPREVHPMSRCFIHEDISEIREHFEDTRYVMRLLTKVHHRIARDLRWAADDAATVRHFKEAYRLRRRASKFEAAYG
jgi:hypothetical protein